MRSTSSNLIENTLKEILDVVPNSIYILMPPPALLKSFIHHAYTRDTLPTTRIFAPKNTYKTTFSNFKTETKAAELSTNHSIAFRVATFNSAPALIYDNTTIALVHDHFIEETNPELASDMHEFISAKWDTTTNYTFTAPALSTLYTSLTTTFGNDVLLDVKEIFDAADNLSPTPTDIVLLIAIRHNISIAEITAWAESLHLTTRGTLSRHRKQLEAQSLIRTTPQHTHSQGRPPLKIVVLDETLTQSPKIALQTLTTATQQN